MKSGKRYQVLMAPSAHRRYRKFNPPLQQKIKQEALKLAEDPQRHEELRGPLRGIRSYHFTHKKAAYRIAYRVGENKNQIEIVPVNSREGFYQTLRKLIR